MSMETAVAVQDARTLHGELSPQFLAAAQAHWRDEAYDAPTTPPPAIVRQVGRVQFNAQGRADDAVTQAVKNWTPDVQEHDANSPYPTEVAAPVRYHHVYCGNCRRNTLTAFVATGAECMSCGQIELLGTPNNDND